MIARRASLSLVFALFLAACSMQPIVYPPRLQPVPVQTMPAAPTTIVTLPPLSSPLPAPTRTPVLPTLDPSPTSIPSATSTATPAVINQANATSLRPVVIYPLFWSGLLRSARWSPDGANIVVDTSMGLQVLSAPGLQKRFNLPDTHPLYFLKNNDLLVLQPDNTLSRLNLADSSTRPVPVQLPKGETGMLPYALSPDAASWVISPDGVSLQVTTLGNAATRSVKLYSRTQIAFQVKDLAFSLDGSRLYARIQRIDNETELIAIDTATWTEVYELFGADSLPIFSPDGERMLYLSGESIRIDLVKDGKNWNSLVQRIENKYSSARESILTAQAYSFLPRTRLLGVIYNGQVRDAQIKDSQFFAATLMFYDTDSTSTVRFLNELPVRITGFDFSPDGSSFLTTSQDGVLRLWNTDSGAMLKASEPFDTDPDPTIRPDGKLVAYAGADHVVLEDPASGKQVATLGNYTDAEKLSAAFVGDNTLAVFVQTAWQRYIETWEISSKRALRRYPDPGNCAFNLNGSILSCFDGTLHFLDMPSGRSLLDQVPQGAGFEYAVSADGSRMAYCTLGSEFVYVWDLRLGGVPKYILGRQSGVCGQLAFSPDGQNLASASGFYWDIATEKLVQSFRPPGGGPSVISPDGALLLVYPTLIDLKTGKSLGQIQTAPGIKAIYFQPDGKNLILKTKRGIELWVAGK